MKKFIIFVLIGLFLGLSCSHLKLEFPIRFFVTISDNLIQILLFMAPIILFVFVQTGVSNLNQSKKEFFIEFILLVILSLSVLGILTFILSWNIIPKIVIDITSINKNSIKPYFLFELTPMFDIFIAFILGIFFGIFSPKDGIINKFMKEVELCLYNYIKYFLLPIMPLWIISSFAKSTYLSYGSSLLLNNISLSIFIFILQILWLILMFFISSLFAKKKFSLLLKNGFSLYAKVLSIMGIGSHIIIPFAIESQTNCNVDKSKAKIISSSAINLPGSFISNIVIAYSINIMFNLEISSLQFIIYIFVLIFATILAPSLPGGVFSVTSSILGPILGFSEHNINTMATLYYNNGTVNACTNNAADIYLGTLLDKNKNSTFKK